MARNIEVARLKVFLPDRSYMALAPAFIAVIIEARPQPPPGGAHTFEIEDSSVATQNIVLAITAFGYASVWLDGALRQEQRAEKVGALLGLPGTRLPRAGNWSCCSLISGNFFLTFPYL